MSVIAMIQVPSPALISAWVGGHTALGSATKFVVPLITPPGVNPPPAEVPTIERSRCSYRSVRRPEGVKSRDDVRLAAQHAEAEGFGHHRQWAGLEDAVAGRRR